MRALALSIGLVGAVVLAACERTGEGEYEVQRPVIGTTTDTVRIPTVDVGTETDTMIVKTPDVDVKTPAERRGDTARKRP